MNPKNQHPCIEPLLNQSPVHPLWRPILRQALAAMDGAYLQSLVDDPEWLPGPDRLLAAFAQSPDQCRYILFGESPYPRKESANGIAFQDAVVDDLWSPTGLGKAVNRATSLRNLIKTLLLAEGLVNADTQGRISQQQIAGLTKSNLVQTLDQLFERLHQAGFLMLNATPVLHTSRLVKTESRYWKPFIEQLLELIGERAKTLPTLVLWGKIAAEIGTLPMSDSFPRITSEHPYNISFIHNPDMQQLFAELKLLQEARAC